MKTKIKIWFLKKLIASITEDAIQANDHLLADQLIYINDALKIKEKCR